MRGHEEGNFWIETEEQDAYGNEEIEHAHHTREEQRESCKKKPPARAGLVCLLRAQERQEHNEYKDQNLAPLKGHIAHTMTFLFIMQQHQQLLNNKAERRRDHCPAMTSRLVTTMTGFFKNLTSIVLLL